MAATISACMVMSQHSIVESYLFDPSDRDIFFCRCEESFRMRFQRLPWWQFVVWSVSLPLDGGERVAQ